MPRLAFEPADYPFFDYRRFTFSLGIAAGGGVWLSGSTAVRFDAARKAMVVDGDLVAQARVILEKMRITLVAGGLGLDDIVRVVQYVTPGGLADLPKLNAFLAEVFSVGAPTVTTIVVKRLLRSEALIEIEAVAARGGRSMVEHLPTVAEADVRTAWARADELLAARGLERRHVVRALELFTPAAAGPAGRSEVDAGPVLRVVMPRMVDAKAGVQIELAASSGGNVLFVTATGDPAAGDVVGQCREIYARVGTLLAAFGAGLDAVVKTTEFVTSAGLDAYRKTADVRREVFALPYPAATGVVCEALMEPGADLAVEAVAVMETR